MLNYEVLLIKVAFFLILLDEKFIFFVEKLEFLFLKYCIVALNQKNKINNQSNK